jgi:hypothetical protein
MNMILLGNPIEKAPVTQKPNRKSQGLRLKQKLPTDLSLKEILTNRILYFNDK